MHDEHLRFGNLHHMRNLVVYKISPYHLKMVPSLRIGNLLRRIVQEAPWILPPFSLGYLLYYSMDRLHERISRKQPGEFDHEEDLESEVCECCTTEQENENNNENDECD
ncbi:cytochrome b-c1 complex subunit 8-like [Diorhabda carinulata]|uniref:cytochrome b-c1 complex subunit 8-like n=1 Tax=Diorhabda carinulata TaxID=1163345 RepID=UPI0025A2868A|nr:cytochrome b-c1 complex subunit 8-like [Diorhabda carinulata]